MNTRIKSLCIIQARLGSTRFPNKVMQPIWGIPIIKLMWLNALRSKVDKIIVAWPERYPDLDENNVLERFRRLVNEFKPEIVIRLTSDCPLITSYHINEALDEFEKKSWNGVNWVMPWFYCNRFKYPDGYDVQICRAEVFNGKHEGELDKEHVFKPYPSYLDKGHFSVDTKEDLCKIKSSL